jgi:hypothetical protein
MAAASRRRGTDKSSAKVPAAADPRKKTSRCSDCGQLGHWKGDAECPKVKSGQTPMHKKAINWVGVLTNAGPPSAAAAGGPVTDAEEGAAADPPKGSAEASTAQVACWLRASAGVP